MPAPYTLRNPIPAPLGSLHLQDPTTSTRHPRGPPLAALHQHPNGIPCLRGGEIPSQHPKTAHLGEVAGQPVGAARPRGGPQREVEGTELARPHRRGGDVELAGGAVPQGNPAAGKLGGMGGGRG